ncbi:hypothetical protein GCM10027615_13480 [Plantactinospora veratri]
MLIGIAALLVIALVGLSLGINALVGDRDPSDGQAGPAPSTGTSTEPAVAGDPEPPAAPPRKVNLKGDQVRVIDPDGTRSELDDVEKAVDGDLNEGWETETYRNGSKFGNKKDGMGILINLGEPREVTSVQVDFSESGVAAELRSGAKDFPATASGDRALVEAYSTRIGNAYERTDSTKVLFSNFVPGQKYQYLMLWITDLPETEPGAARWKIGVQEITVQSR